MKRESKGTGVQVFQKIPNGPRCGRAEVLKDFVSIVYDKPLRFWDFC